MKKPANTPAKQQQKTWSAPQITVCRMQDAQLDLSLQHTDGVLYQAS